MDDLLARGERKMAAWFLFVLGGRLAVQGQLARHDADTIRLIWPLACRLVC